jgi:uncharacterized oxidoreductase
VSAITLPGDPERNTRLQRKEHGITLDDGTWGQLSALAERLQVALPSVV